MTGRIKPTIIIYTIFCYKSSLFHKKTPIFQGKRRSSRSKSGDGVLKGGGVFFLPAGKIKLPSEWMGVFAGASDEARTRYLHLGKVALYQMSYTRSDKWYYSTASRKVNRENEKN